jgi:hypothetical protein
LINFCAQGLDTGLGGIARSFLWTVDPKGCAVLYWKTGKMEFRHQGRKPWVMIRMKKFGALLLQRRSIFLGERSSTDPIVTLKQGHVPAGINQLGCRRQARNACANDNRGVAHGVVISR